MKIFAYVLETYEDDELCKDKGILWADGYSHAVQKIEKFCAPYNEQNPSVNNSITSLSLWEIDSYTGGIVDLSTIKECFGIKDEKQTTKDE